MIAGGPEPRGPVTGRPTAGASREIVELNGWWHAAFEDSDAWRSERLPEVGMPPSALPVHLPQGGWEALERNVESAEVPGTWEASRPGHHGVGWHWRPLDIPGHWEGRVVRLRFEGVRLYAEVYLDDVLVGYDLDGLTPFELDVTDRVRPGGSYELAVRVVNPGGMAPGEAPQPLEWGGRRLPPSHDLGGLWGGVSLIATSPCYVSSVTPTPAPDLQTLRLTCRLVSRGVAREGVLTASVAGAEGEVWTATPLEVHLAADEEQVAVVEVPLPGAAPWFPEAPRLYSARVSLRSGDGLSDGVALRVGIRHVEAGARGVLLNGRPYPLRVAPSHGAYPALSAQASARLAEQEVRSAREMGLNALHVVGHVPAPALLDAADRLGLLVLCSPPLQGGEEDLVRQRLDRLRQQWSNHPSAVLVVDAVAEGADSAPAGGWEEALGALPRVPAPPAAIPDLTGVVARYGSRRLPGSAAAAWAGRLQRLSREFAAHHLERVLADLTALSRATSRAAYQDVALGVLRARAHGADAGYVLPPWADGAGGALGLTDVFRLPKVEPHALAQAAAPLALLLDGLSMANPMGACCRAAIWVLNEERRRESCVLQARLIGPDGRLVFDEAGWVTLTGEPAQRLGDTDLVASSEGEYVMLAELRRAGEVFASTRHSFWVTNVSGAPVQGLGVLGPVERLYDTLERWEVGWRQYTLGDPLGALLVTTPEPEGGLANALFSGAIRRVALLLGDLPCHPADPEHGWCRWLPELQGAVDVSVAADPPWLIGGRSRLLRGVGDPGVWWHAGPSLAPRYVLRSPAGDPVLSACLSLPGADEQGGPTIGTALSLTRLGEAELLLSTLPLVTAVKAGDPLATRLLQNTLAWLGEAA